MPTFKNPDAIELRSEEVQEILGTPPIWMIRWGTTLFFVVFLILALVSWWVKYPDIIQTPVTLTTLAPPISVNARADGRIAALKVTENDTVHTGDLLVVLQSASNYEDILTLSKQLRDLQEYENFADFQATKKIDFGDLNVPYLSFAQAHEAYITALRGAGYNGSNVSRLYNRIKINRSEMTNNGEKKKNLEIKLEMTRKNFNLLKDDYSSGKISLAEYRNAYNKIQDAELELKNVLSAENQKHLEIETLKSKIIDIQQTAKQGNSIKYARLKENMSTLRTAIEKWKQNYCLFAPTEGRVTFFSKLRHPQQYIKSGEEVMTILPFEAADNNIIGRILLKSSGAGKVREGQRVILKMDSYPYHEYGTIEAIVQNKSFLPKDNRYFVQISLPNGLKTNYGTTLKFEQQMQGKADIVTEDRRFIERIFDRFSSLVK